MPQESASSLSSQIALFQEARAQEAVRRAVQEPSLPWGISHLYLILESAPSIVVAAKALASALSADEVLALIVSDDPELSALGREMASYLDANTLETMALSGHPTLAEVAGMAILRALLEAPESEP